MFCKSQWGALVRPWHLVIESAVLFMVFCLHPATANIHSHIWKMSSQYCWNTHCEFNSTSTTHTHMLCTHMHAHTPLAKCWEACAGTSLTITKNSLVFRVTGKVLCECCWICISRRSRVSVVGSRLSILVRISAVSQGNRATSLLTVGEVWGGASPRHKAKCSTPLRSAITASSNSL